MNLPEQIHVYGKYEAMKLESGNSMLTGVVGGLLECREKELLRRGLERLTGGFSTYADVTWRKTPDQVEEELLDELADALVYAAIMLHRVHQS